MSIRLAKPAELVEVMYLLKVCSIEMNSMGCLYWNYYNKQLTPLIEKDNLFIYKYNESTIGALTINNECIQEYNQIEWEFSSNKFLAIQLLVHPKWRDKEICRELLTYAEKYATENAYPSIRLDVHYNNNFAINVLNVLGYKKAGEIHLPFHKFPFICFEKETVKV